MKNKKKHIDDLFREKLGTYSEVPPADAWSALDSKLDTLTTPQVPTSPFRWLGHAAMVSVIAVLGVSVVHKINQKGDGTVSSNKEQEINKIDASTSEFAVDNSTNNAGEVSVPENSSFGGDDNENNEVTENTNAGSLSANETEENAGYQGRGAQRSGSTSMQHSSGKGNGSVSRYGGNEQTINSLNESDNNLQPNSTISERSEPQNADNEFNEVKTKNNLKGTADEKKQTQAAPLATKIPNKKPAPIDPAGKEKPVIDFARWSAGVKAGYEFGMDKEAATKYVVAPYVQYNVTRKLSVMIQPGAKFANAPVRTIGSSASYYKVNDDGRIVNRGDYSTIRVEGSSIDTFYHSRLSYSQSHDSIVKTNKAGGVYREFELPVLVKYNFTEKLAVYGGVNMIYSQLQGVKEHTYTKSAILKTVDTVISAKGVAPTAPAVNEVITHSGASIAEYNGPLYPASHTNQMRFGTMLGVTYSYNERLMVDALVQKNPAPADMKEGYNINAPLSATYFRISVGYKLTR
ncbi:MAG: hypothetical protein JNM41_11300 [Flavipsychrobacter sp.]|nr:hypothetical protein [Flavipsychrobacter sp.]